MRRVASIPSHHPYVAAVLPTVLPAPWPAVAPLRAEGAAPGATGAGRLPDPLPDGRAPDEGVWWPPRLLEADWLTEHADQVDLVHLHFGFEGRSPDQLRAWLQALDRAGLPLVLTVHDLDNPHLSDQGPHEAALDLLVPAADAVLTLTPSAAATVRRRWQVAASVLPHPQVVDDRTLLASDRTRQEAHDGPDPVVGVHLGALRANADPRPWLPALAAAVGALGGRLEVVVNDEVLASGDDRRLTLLDEVREQLAEHPGASVQVLPRMDDDSLHRWVCSLDVAALPYAHGTHSGWLEMCWDLGTSVLAPPVGCYADQHPEPGFAETLEAATAEEALRRLLAARAAGCPWGDAPARLDRRRTTADQVRAAHETAYARLAPHPSPEVTA